MNARNYTLRYAKSEEFYGFDTPAAVLTAMAAFDNANGNSTHIVTLSWSEDAQYGGSLTWEDING